MNGWGGEKWDGRKWEREGYSYSYCLQGVLWRKGEWECRSVDGGSEARYRDGGATGCEANTGEEIR